MTPDNAHICTGSNDPGQLGSCYGIPCLGDCCREYEAQRAKDRAEFEAVFDSEDLS